MQNPKSRKPRKQADAVEHAWGEGGCRWSVTLQIFLSFLTGT